MSNRNGGKINTNPYSNCLEISEFEDIVELFNENLVDTNRDHNFFVDWEKVENNVNKFKSEFELLNSLIGCENFDDELKEIIQEKPSVICSIPILIANRDLKFKVIEDFSDPDTNIIEYNCKNRIFTDEEIDKTIDLVEKTGLKNFIQNSIDGNLYDFALGIETGMDTHARKNRSGKAMELVLKPLIEEISENNDYEMFFQKKFKILEEEYEIDVPTSIRNRRADFILVNTDSKVINIEVNFYTGTGSKPQEIVDSYINRQMDLEEAGFEFIWVTDGDGWKGQQNQIKKGFRRVNYLLNLHFVRKGLLEEIINDLV